MFNADCLRRTTDAVEKDPAGTIGRERTASWPIRDRCRLQPSLPAQFFRNIADCTTATLSAGPFGGWSIPELCCETPPAPAAHLSPPPDRAEDNLRVSRHRRSGLVVIDMIGGTSAKSSMPWQTNCSDPWQGTSGDHQYLQKEDQG
jgi:hypothetical protein